ncbi:cytochrome c1 [Altererythrobacter salegens]|uniref:Cytochrome c1 n=1 Tax=Croceibacterium salegens TaxID=1737568 RepID=A0A6I4SZF5_9SPHN|nr:cytochrome c1 [Croceibacterium salegens]MXO60610.1 cytochrome c1 [Croceibacterium salegens]
MVRIIGILVGLFFTAAVLWAFGNGAVQVASQDYFVEKTAETEFHLHPKELDQASDHLVAHWDKQQLQRGYQVYKEVCAACHSLRHVAFRDLEQIGYTEAQVKAIAATWQVPGVDPVTGEATTVPGKPTDYFPLVYLNDVAARAANNNAIPPDLSLMTKARHEGPAYVYSLLTGYSEIPAELTAEFPDFSTPPGLHFNRYFANLNLAMPPPLAVDDQVTYADGTPATIDQMAKDVSAFLTWTAEPSLPKRKQTGWPVIGFLIFATILAYLAKKQIWARAKKKA